MNSDGSWGVVKLPVKVQAELLQEHPDVFEACNGAWGRSGATIVKIKLAEEGMMLRALVAAWSKFAPPSLTDSLAE